MRFNSFLISSSLVLKTRILKAVTPSTNSLSKAMDFNGGGGGGGGGSQRLRNLAQQLRLYRPPPPASETDEIDEQQREESGGKVVSQVGFAESSTPIVATERFRCKKAAVLICLFEDDGGDLRVILTKRSSKLSTHSGEVSLPGGKAEEGDANDAETATREAHEEIGLEPSLVNVVTVLEPFLSKLDIRLCHYAPSPDIWIMELYNHHKHLLRVVPVIGILTNRQAFKPMPNAAEVDAIFDAPLEMFLKDENRVFEEREWLGDNYLVHIFNYKEENREFLIWGLTAGILIRAASVVYQRPPAFLEQKPFFKVPKVIDEGTTTMT